MASDALRELAVQCVGRWLEPREYLFHAGEQADNLYLIASGSLEVVWLRHAGGGEDSEIVLNVLGPRRAVGELALLRGEQRSASVRAKGRSYVYALDGPAFLAFLRRWPEAAVAIARSTADSLVRIEKELHLGAARRLWTVLPGGAVPDGFAIELARAAVPYLRGAASDRVVVWSAGPEQSLRDGKVRVDVRSHGGAAGDELADLAAESLGDAGLVVVTGDPAALEETARRASAVVSGGAGAPLPRLSAVARHIELITGGLATSSRVRVDGLAPAAVAGRVARLLCDRSIGVALGGGAARGLAHIGVLEVLEELGVPIDFVAGTSIGAIVGAYFLANGVAGAADFARDMKRPVEMLRLLDPGILVSGLVPMKKIARHFGGWLRAQTFADLKLPFAAVALDLDRGDELVLRDGPLLPAILASSAIPGIFAPVPYRPPGSARELRLVDGGVTSNVPVEIARQLGAHRVIGIHAYQRDDPRLQSERAGRGWLTSRLARLPTIARALNVVRSQLLGHERSGHRQVLAADLAVLVDTGALGFTEFWRGDEFIDAGRRAARAIADEIRLLGP